MERPILTLFSYPPGSYLLYDRARYLNMPDLGQFLLKVVEIEPSTQSLILLPLAISVEHSWMNGMPVNGRTFKLGYDRHRHACLTTIRPSRLPLYLTWPNVLPAMAKELRMRPI